MGAQIDEFGTLHHLQLLEDKPDFQIMTVVFGEPISRIDRSVFEDVATWGVCSLQGWVNSYESVRFVAIDDHTAIITGEYNMEQVKVWLEKYTSIKSLKPVDRERRLFAAATFFREYRKKKVAKETAYFP